MPFLPELGKSKFVPLLATLVLFLSIFAGVTLVKKRQELRSQAQVSQVTYNGPIMINASNYIGNISSYKNYPPMTPRLTVLQPSAYNRSVLESIRSQDPNAEMRIGFRSVTEMKSLLTVTEVQVLHDLGVTSLTYNPESEPESSQFLQDDSNSNPAVQFVDFAHANGFRAILVPFGRLFLGSNNIPDSVLQRLYDHGLDGFVIQAQNFIDRQCPVNLASQIESIVEKHRSMAGRAIETGVQIMTSACQESESIACSEPSGQYQFQRCDIFIDELVSRGVIDIMAIWAMAQAGDQTPLVQVVRAGTGEPLPPPPPPTGISTPTPTPIVTLQPPPGEDYECTMVIGYSQVGLTWPDNLSPLQDGWYVAPIGANNFEKIVGDDRWQLLWHGGHGVDVWQNPSAAGWGDWETKNPEYFISPCITSSNAPERVLLSVSGPYGEDEQAWATNIQAAINTIRQKLPSVENIILQAVVGGPNHATCSCVENCYQGDTIRASWQHKHIDVAIETVAAQDSNVFAGYSPEVRSCSDYADGLGHLTPVGARSAGQKTGEYYASLTPQLPSPTIISTPTPTRTPTKTPTSVPTPTPLPGDINGDGTVNILDFQILNNNFGTNNPNTDLNGDGIVNILDFQILSNNFGSTN